MGSLRGWTTDRRAQIAYWIGATLVVVIGIGGAISFMTSDYEQRFGFARRDLLVLSKTLAQHTLRIFDSLDALSRLVAEDTRRATSPEDLSDILERRIAAEPAALRISVADRDGRIVASSEPDGSTGADISETEVYRALRAPDASPTHISKPVLLEDSPADGADAWVVDYARRLQDRNGEFDGLITIVVNTPHLYSFYSQISPGEDGVIYLVGTDGIIRAWSGSYEAAIGADVSAAIADELALGEGTRLRPGAFRGMERVFAFSKVPGFPLMVSASVAAAPIYAAFVRNAALILSLLAVLIGASIALGLLLRNHMRERDRVTRASIAAASERQERMFLESILETGGALVLVTDPEGRLVVANHAFLDVFAPEHNGERRDAWLRQILGGGLDEVLTGLPYKAEVNVTDRRGRKRELSWTVTTIRDDEGRVRNLVAVGFDNTERREAELAVFQSGKLITLGEMATGLAHEINQPLGTIGMAVDNLSARLAAHGADELYIRQTLQRVREQIDRASAIIDHMRIFGRYSDGAVAPLDPVTAIEGVLLIADAQLRHAGITLRRNYVAGTWTVLADQILLEQILLNIILNARDAILEARSAGRSERAPDAIGISIAGTEHTVEISIGDTGTGIPPENLDKIFHPFFTTKEVAKGTGLGLALSYGMAKDLGGDIRARNRPEGGAEFTVVLQAASAASAKPSRRAS